jgi:RNA polymerase sigma-70 factor, ECF subfamily
MESTESIPAVAPVPSVPRRGGQVAPSRAAAGRRMTVCPVSEADAESFAGVRPRLYGIARRVLGNASDADDVVQDAWIRWQGTDRSAVRDPLAFLATMTARLALTAGQSARARREIPIGPVPGDVVDLGADPSRDAERREAVDRSLVALLEKLSATERAAYILREAFDYPHRRTAEVLGLSEANARQLVTRARARLGGARRRHADPAEHSRLLDAFAAAAQTGELAALERLLAADAAEERAPERVAA